MTIPQNTSALVCGASQGIGRAIAIELAQKGVRVHAVARSEDKLKNLLVELKEITNLDHQVTAVDFEDSQSLEQLLLKLKEQSLQILVCNSGGPKAGPLAEAQPEEFWSGFQAHIIANQKLVQAVIPSMKSSGWGRIINVISTSVKSPIPNLGVSNTIRGAVAQWAKTLSLELGPLNITVNNVLPGYTETERLEKLAQAAAQRLDLTKDQVMQNWKQVVPLRRFAQAQEVAWAVSFLSSQQAAYISGINLPVDGGRTSCL